MGPTSFLGYGEKVRLFSGVLGVNIFILDFREQGPERKTQGTGEMSFFFQTAGS